MRHDAFLSYSHVDARIARELERGVETLAKPVLKLRALDVFRDETALAASPALWPSIVEHLQASDWFLLLASRESAASTWCTKEIEWWLANRSVDRLLLVLTDGDLVWNAAAGDFDFERTTAVARVLGGRFDDEPLYTDLRWARSEQALSLRNARFRDAVLNVAAPLRGVPKDELDGADVRQLRRNRRFVRTLFAAIAAALLVALWQWRTAVNQRDAAQAQARVAMSRKLVADSRLPGRPLDVSLLLAAEAYQIAPTRDAHEHLIRLAHENDRFEQFLQGPQASVTAVAFGRGRMLTADGRGRLSLWERGDYSSGRKLQLMHTVTTVADQPVQAVRVTQKGDHAVVVHQNGLVRAVGIGEGKLDVRSNTQCPDWSGAQVIVNADGSRAAVRQEDGTGTVWRLDALACVLERTLGPVPKGIAFSPSGHYLAAPRPEGGVMWWSVDGRTGGSEPASSSNPYKAFMVAISGSDSVMAVASLNRVTVWRVDPDGRTRQVLTSSVEGFRSMAFSRRGDKLAVGLADGTVDLWRLGQDGPVREQLRGHRYGFHVVDLAFNESGTMLASGAEDGILMLWYLGYGPQDKVLVRELHGHARPITFLAFDSDRAVASASATAVILWNAGIGSDKPFLSHLGRNETVGSSYHDPKTGVTLSLPGILLREEDKNGCWLVADARRSAGRRLTVEERRDVIGDLAYTPTCPELDTPESERGR